MSATNPFSELTDEELRLVFLSRRSGDEALERAPAYYFHMQHAFTGEIMGEIELRGANYRGILLYSGHIGYEVFPAFRGNHYAERACRLLFPAARRLGLDPLWITCNPENLPSRRTCERLGGVLVDIVDVPRESDLYARGDHRKCRYRVDLARTTPA